MQTVVARIYDYRRAEIYERLGIPTIATVPWTAHGLVQLVLARPHTRSGGSRPTGWRWCPCG